MSHQDWYGQWTLCDTCHGQQRIQYGQAGEMLPASTTWADSGTASKHPIASEPCPDCDGTGWVRRNS
jgi:DnaJ-class molecular chaperone